MEILLAVLLVLVVLSLFTGWPTGSRPYGGILLPILVVLLVLAVAGVFD